MSVSFDVIRLLARFLKRTGLHGRALTYGVQGIEGTYPGLIRCLEREQFAYRPLDPDQIRLDAVTEEYGTSVHQDVLFKLLGFAEVESLDIYPDEGPTHLLDLNQPIPSEFHQQYDLVFDGGTLEHCFNVAEALFNSARLVKPGGYMVHLNPVSGLVNHGFYQFCPTLYYDFYAENGFDDLEMKILLEDRYLDFDPAYIFNDYLGEPALVLFFARKREMVAPLRMPIQNAYRQKFETPAAAQAGNGKPSLSDWKAKIPSRHLLKWLLQIRKRMQLARYSRPI